MTFLEIVGWLMLATPFIGLFGFIVKSEDFKTAAMIYMMVMGSVTFLYIGATLAGFE